MIELGDHVRDRITGFEGVVISITDWLFGCRRPYVQPNKLDKEGKVLEAQSFDEPQLEIVKRGVISRVAPVAMTRTGGPGPNPTQRPDPR